MDRCVTMATATAEFASPERGPPKWLARLSVDLQTIIIVVIIVLVVLFVLGYFGRGRMRG